MGTTKEQLAKLFEEWENRLRSKEPSIAFHSLQPL